MTVPIQVGTVYKHVKTGKTYEVVCFARNEANPAQQMVIYKATFVDPEFQEVCKWVRPCSEFSDGRFQPVDEDLSTKAYLNKYNVLGKQKKFPL